MPDEADFPKDLQVAAASSRNCPFTLPHPVHAHLDQLLHRSRAAGAGARTSRSEVVAALIVDARREGEELKQLLDRYRIATVADLGIGDDDSKFVRLPLRQRPGPR